MKLHQTPKLPGDASTAAASMVLQLELGPGSKFECFKLLNSPVSAIYLGCPRSIAIHRAPGDFLPPDWKSYPQKQPLITISIRAIMMIEIGLVQFRRIRLTLFHNKERLR